MTVQGNVTCENQKLKSPFTYAVETRWKLKRLMSPMVLGLA
jgi:hypothetical protein